MRVDSGIISVCRVIEADSRARKMPLIIDKRDTPIVVVVVVAATPN